MLPSERLAWSALTTWCHWLKEQGARGTGEVMTGNLRLSAPAGPMWIAPGETARLIVPTPYGRYTAEGLPKMKAVAGRRWHPDENHWAVPYTVGSSPTC